MRIHAIYENGVFRPPEPVDLPEHAPVIVLAQAAATPRRATVADLERLRGTLASWPDDPVEGQRRMRDQEWLCACSSTRTLSS